jgi:hypothetical protein
VVKVSVRKFLKRKQPEDTNEFAQEKNNNLKKLKMSHDQCTPEKEVKRFLSFYLLLHLMCTILISNTLCFFLHANLECI